MHVKVWHAEKCSSPRYTTAGNTMHSINRKTLWVWKTALIISLHYSCQKMMLCIIFPLLVSGRFCIISIFTCIMLYTLKRRLCKAHFLYMCTLCLNLGYVMMYFPRKQYNITVTVLATTLHPSNFLQSCQFFHWDMFWISISLQLESLLFPLPCPAPGLHHNDNYFPSKSSGWILSFSSAFRSGPPEGTAELEAIV